MRVLVIDNYDSFVYNLVQYLAQLGADVTVRRNDEVDLDELDGFDGVLVTSAVLDEQAQMNRALDITFVVRTLLSPDHTVELVKAADPDRTVAALSKAVTDALGTPEGRARLALAGAIGNIPTWDNAHNPQPTELAERIRQQATWTLLAYIASGPGPKGRLDLERRAGGNPVYNIGVDYARLLERSGLSDTVTWAYRAAPGADLNAEISAQRAASDMRRAAS